LLVYISFTLLGILGSGAGRQDVRRTWNQHFILHRQQRLWEWFLVITGYYATDSIAHCRSGPRWCSRGPITTGLKLKSASFLPYPLAPRRQVRRTCPLYGS